MALCAIGKMNSRLTVGEGSKVVPQCKAAHAPAPCMAAPRSISHTMNGVIARASLVFDTKKSDFENTHKIIY